MQVEWISVEQALPELDTFVWFVYQHEFSDENKDYVCFGKFLPSDFGNRFLGSELVFPGNTIHFYESDNYVSHWTYADVPEFGISFVKENGHNHKD